MDERHTIDPPSVSSIASMAYLQVRNIPRPSTAITWSQSSGVASTMVLKGMTPAFATRTSIRPKRSTAAPIMRFASSGLETSPTTVSTSMSSPANLSRSSPSPASSTSVRTRSAPSRAKSSAVARPIPFAAPVTTADLPRSRPRPGVTPVSSIGHLLEGLQVPVLVELWLRRLSHDLDVAVLQRFVHQILGEVDVLQVQRVRDADEAGLFGRDAPVAPDRSLQSLPVVLEDHWDLRPLYEGARHYVGVH